MNTEGHGAGPGMERGEARLGRARLGLAGRGVERGLAWQETRFLRTREGLVT